MIKYVLAGLFLIHLNVFAEPAQAKKPIICDDSKIILASLENNYKESPAVIANGRGNLFLFFYNKKTKDWTLVETQNEFMCILGTGNGVDFLLKNMFEST